ncbi:MAG: hypothetical protein CMG75_05365 [Candidatus Marinimicrobia bacterium]|nr:hypothetical protein [Candidatus Neomarinimicrobiota bacterium]
MMKNNRISSYRKKIDRLDDQLVDIIVERFALTLQIGELKKKNNLRITDTSREEEILNRITERINSRLNPNEIKEIFHLIFQISKKLQKKK